MSTSTLPAMLAGYRALIRKRLLIFTLLILALFVAMVLDINTGATESSVYEVFSALLQTPEADPDLLVIIWELRLPYALLAVLVGMALSLAGAEMQTILNNPLASPFTLGVSSAASLGAALAFILEWGIPGVPSVWLVSANAFLFAFTSVLLLQLVSQWRGTGVETLVLFGIALVFSFNAAVALLQYIASPGALQQLVFWSMGSLSRASWSNLQALLIVLLCVLPFSWRAAWHMTALRLGEERAQSFGIDTSRLRFNALFRISLLSATAVAFVGTIGFIGLVGPHIARMMVGEDHRFFLPASVLIGGLVMSLASIASKSLVPGVILPVGIVTALVGVPIFLSLIFKTRSPT